MFWFFYQWLWPLFEPCTTANALAMSGLSPLQVRYGNGGAVYTFNGPMAWTLSVCPTPMMNLVLLLAVLGVVLIVVGIVWFIRTVLWPAPQAPLDLIVDETYQQLDRAADDYLKRAHF
jgi:hypothetical protein